MRVRFVVVATWLFAVGCSAASGGYSATSVSDPSDAPDGATADVTQASSDAVDYDAAGPDSTTVDASAGADAADGAMNLLDSATAPDTSIVDAGIDSDASDADTGLADTGAPDAGNDAADGAAFVCNDGDSRCDSYQYQVCIANAWAWQTGKQTCCNDTSRWTILTATTVYDTSTGLTWYRYPWIGGGSCQSVLPGSALPTAAQYQAIVIGQPVVRNNLSYSVCDPTYDNVAFPNPPTNRSYLVNDGTCFDMLYGVADPTCSAGAATASLCVK